MPTSHPRLPARRTQRGAIALIAASMTVAFAPSASGPDHTHAPGAPPHVDLGQLDGGHVATLDDQTMAAFWNSPYLTCTTPPGLTAISAPMSCDEQPPFVWTVTVADAAASLWVDFDQPYRQDDWTLTVTGPDGATATQASHNTYSEGVRITTPANGVWTLSLQPIRTNGSQVRMRAGLVDPTAPSEGALLPNLRVTPPFEFGFAAPVNPTNSLFLAGDDQNPPASINGTTLNSCALDEVQEAADPTRQQNPKLITRCLRLTTGPHNIGEGHFDLRFPIVDRALGDQDRVMEMTQLIHQSDGSTVERDAGSYEYHASHGHYHYLDILFYEAFEVVDASTGELSRVGNGNKSGFCPADQGYGEWTTFDQQAGGALSRIQGSDSCFAFSGNGAMGLTAGWGDFYRWQRSGQYIDFTGVGDGSYVVRATVDILDNVLETDETDNASYALIEVVGDVVTILERGYGASPYEATRTIVTDNRVG